MPGAATAVAERESRVRETVIGRLVGGDWLILAYSVLPYADENTGGAGQPFRCWWDEAYALGVLLEDLDRKPGAVAAAAEALRAVAGDHFDPSRGKASGMLDDAANWEFNVGRDATARPLVSPMYQPLGERIGYGPAIRAALAAAGTMAAHDALDARRLPLPAVDADPADFAPDLAAYPDAARIVLSERGDRLFLSYHDDREVVPFLCRSRDASRLARHLRGLAELPGGVSAVAAVLRAIGPQNAWKPATAPPSETWHFDVWYDGTEPVLVPAELSED